MINNLIFSNLYVIEKQKSVQKRTLFVREWTRVCLLFDTLAFGEISDSYSVGFAGIAVRFAITPAYRVVLSRTHHSVVGFFGTFVGYFFLLATR
jgi:hypothetical protein